MLHTHHPHTHKDKQIEIEIEIYYGMMFSRDSAIEKEGPRVGCFLSMIQTPAPLCRTFMGNPLYTTPDALDEISFPFLGQLDIADLVHRDFKDLPLDKLFTKKDNCVWILSGRSSGGAQQATESNCDSAGMSIDTQAGRKLVNVSDYVQRLKIDCPPAVIAFADEVNTNIGKKRLAKAIERSATWFQTFVNTSASSAGISFSGSGSSDCNQQSEDAVASSSTVPFLFGVAQYNPFYQPQLPVLVKHMLSQGARGMVVGNLHKGETAEQRKEAITAVKHLLPANVPLMVQGADTITEVKYVCQPKYSRYINLFAVVAIILVIVAITIVFLTF
jgi:hypothetical protein